MLLHVPWWALRCGRNHSIVELWCQQFQQATTRHLKRVDAAIPGTRAIEMLLDGLLGRTECLGPKVLICPSLRPSSVCRYALVVRWNRPSTLVPKCLVKRLGA